MPAPAVDDMYLATTVSLKTESIDRYIAPESRMIENSSIVVKRQSLQPKYSSEFS